MMHWFGRDPWAPLCDDCPKANTPVSHPCGWCGEPIQAGEDGVFVPCTRDVEHVLLHDGGVYLAFHYECNLRSMIGGLNHLLGICSCCGGTAEPDPPKLSKRKAAQAAVAHWIDRRNQL